LFGQTALVIHRQNIAGGSICVPFTCTGCSTKVAPLMHYTYLTPSILAPMQVLKRCKKTYIPIPLPFPLPDNPCLINFPGLSQGYRTMHESLLAAKIEKELPFRATVPVREDRTSAYNSLDADGHLEPIDLTPTDQPRIIIEQPHTAYQEVDQADTLVDWYNQIHNTRAQTITGRIETVTNEDVDQRP
jgi:hypothetical protein